MATLNDNVRALLDGTSYVTLATLNPDGSPQTSVLWVKRDGDDVLLSTVVGRRKDKNLRRDPRASLTVFDTANPYQYAEIRGTAALDERGGRELIDELARKYTGNDYPGEADGVVRVVVRITPERVTGTLA
ncbi:PPOX class F420-dependent oxidoreductase [Allokutzneria oryzae]|uniref:PPOX class F420-dependent oxidoreductase n=1 Tax=Allokutzneria oryzae TaxID=1378989 RepID=A0ABV6A1L3_9PSEU